MEPTLKARLKACWRILNGKQKTVWKRVAWGVPSSEGNPGYTFSCYIGMQDDATMVEKDSLTHHAIFGAQAEEQEAHTPYIPTSTK